MTRTHGPVRPRFFQIGFKRCGTTAVALFFNRCGIPCVHHDKGRLARRMRDNLAAGRAPLDGYDRRYAAFTNIDFQTPTDHFDGFRHFGALLAAYGGRCILNTRPVDNWLRSVMRNADRRACAPRIGRASQRTTRVKLPISGARRGKSTTGVRSRKSRPTSYSCSISNPIFRNGSAISSACRARVRTCTRWRIPGCWRLQNRSPPACRRRCGARCRKS